MLQHDPSPKFLINPDFLDFPENCDLGCISGIFLEKTVKSPVIILEHNGMIVVHNNWAQ